MTKRLAIGCALCLPLLIGCATTPTIVPEPGKITLQEAMKSVGEGLVEMKKAQGNVKTGLVPASAEVTFNISASAKDAGKLYVEVGAPAEAPVTGKLGGSTSFERNASRGNQVTIKFENLLLSDEAVLAQKKSPQEIKDLFDALKDIGMTVYLTN